MHNKFAITHLIDIMNINKKQLIRLSVSYYPRILVIPIKRLSIY